MSAAGDLVFVGDVHLDRNDPDVEPFGAFLAQLGRTAQRIVLMGDLFNLWIGRPELEQAHQATVLAVLEGLRDQGVVVRYVEGNRDYRIGAPYVGRALDDVAPQGLDETIGGHRIRAVHGDGVNPHDRQYRAWRALSRSAPFWWAFNLLPRRRRLRLAESIEARMRASNRGFKRRFPEAAVLDYGRRVFGRGYDLLVLGHFHVERVLSPGAEGRIFVLPLWKDGRRYLRLGEDGEIRFDTWNG